MRDELLTNLSHINAQLGDLNRQIDGRRMTDEEWNDWRRSAVRAKGATEQRLRRVKRWLQQASEADAELRKLFFAYLKNLQEPGAANQEAVEVAFEGARQKMEAIGALRGLS